MKEIIRQKIAILGAGGFGEEIADIISDIESFELVGFVESADRKRCGQTLMGAPVLWIDEAAGLGDACRFVCSVGSPALRKPFTALAASLGLKFATVVHPTAHIAPSASLGCGTVISPGAIVASHTRIGNHTLINRGCLIGHHAHIGDYVTVSPGANIAGRTHIEESVYVGMGSIILDGLSVGQGSVVGSGALVTKNIPDHVQVMGMPARVTRENIEGK
ncbi:MAG: acetyltransferase [Smithellaceae bacterium]